MPTASTVLNNEAVPNCCKFERKGSRIVVGDDSGRIRIFTINDVSLLDILFTDCQQPS